MGSFRVAVSGIAAIAVLLGAAVGSSATERATGILRLDGVPFSPELALTPEQRSLGLMHRKRAPKDGMLFVFPADTTGGFWMKNTLVPLAIVFFNADGRRVRRLSMTPCRQASCPIYDPRRRYRFALELRASDLRQAARLGPVAQLQRLTRRAS